MKQEERPVWIDDSGSLNINTEILYPRKRIQKESTIQIDAEVTNIVIPRKSASVTLKNTEKEVTINVKRKSTIKI